MKSTIPFSNKKGITQIVIGIIIVLVIVVAAVTFVSWYRGIIVKAYTKDEVNSDLDKKSMQTQGNPPPIICGSGTLLNQQTNQCVATTQSNQQQTTTQSNQQQTTAQPTLKPSAGSDVIRCNAPSGFFSIVYSRQRNNLNCGFNIDNCKAQIVGIYKYTGDCPADIYIEAGFRKEDKTNNLLSVLPPELVYGNTLGLSGNCDSSTHYNGVVFKNVQPNGDLRFDLRPENYGEEGTYRINIGAYSGGTKTGCINYGGYTLNEFKSAYVSFSDSYYRGYCPSGSKCIDDSYAQVTS